MTRCLVTGATGFVGSHLVDHLLAAGYPVSCTVRPTSDTRWIKGTGAQLVPCRLEDVEDVSKALFNVERVYHVAGAIAAASTTGFFDVNEGLTRSVLEACGRQEAPPRFVYVSSLAAAGPSLPGQRRTEEMPAAPVSDYGRSKLAGEQAVADFSDRVPGVIVRPPVVYGARDQAMLTVFRLAASPLRPAIGARKDMSLVHVTDLVRGIVMAGESEQAPGRTYFLAHPETLTMRALGDRLSQILGSGGRTVGVPDQLIPVAAAASEVAARILRRQATLTRDKAREIVQAGWACDPSRARQELGFEAQIPHDEGLRETASWYKQAGWL